MTQYRQNLSLDILSQSTSHITLNASCNIASLLDPQSNRTNLHDLQAPFNHVKLSYDGLPQAGRPGWSHCNANRLATNHGSTTIVWDINLATAKHTILCSLRFDDNLVLDKDWNWINENVLATVNRLSIQIWDIRESPTRPTQIIENPFLIRDIKTTQSNSFRERLAWNKMNSFILASTTNNDDIAIWDIRSCSSPGSISTPVSLLYGHERAITCMDWSPIRIFELLSGDEGGYVKLWGGIGSTISSSSVSNFRCISTTQATPGPIKRLQYAPSSIGERNLSIVVGEMDYQIKLLKLARENCIERVSASCNSLALWDFNHSSCVLTINKKLDNIDNTSESVYDATWSSNRNSNFDIVSISSPENLHSLKRSLRFWKISDELLRSATSPKSPYEEMNNLYETSFNSSSQRALEEGNDIGKQFSNNYKGKSQWNLNFLKPDLLPLQSLFTNEVSSSSSYLDYDLLLEMPGVHELIENLNLQTFEIVTETSMCVSFKLYDAPKAQPNSKYLQCRVDIPSTGFVNPVWTVLSAQSTFPIPSGLKQKLDSVTSFYYPKKLPFLLQAIGILRESIGENRDSEGLGSSTGNTATSIMDKEIHQKSEEQKKLAMPCPRISGATFSSGGQLVFFCNDILERNVPLPKTYFELESLMLERMNKRLSDDNSNNVSIPISNSYIKSPLLNHSIDSGSALYLEINKKNFNNNTVYENSIDSRNSLSKSAPVNNFLDNVGLSSSLPSTSSRDYSEKLEDNSEGGSSYNTPVFYQHRHAINGRERIDSNNIRNKNFAVPAREVILNQNVKPSIAKSQNKSQPKPIERPNSILPQKYFSSPSGSEDSSSHVGRDIDGDGDESSNGGKTDDDSDDSGVNEHNSLYNTAIMTGSPTLGSMRNNMFNPSSYVESRNNKTKHSITKSSSSVNISASYREKVGGFSVGSFQQIRPPTIGGGMSTSLGLRSPTNDKDLSNAVSVNDSSNVGRRIVKIISTTSELPSCKTLSAMYEYIPLRNQINDERSAMKLCEYNANISRLMKRFDLERIWIILGGILNPILNNKLNDPSTKTSWSKHPLALKIIEKVLLRYQMIGDVQMVASISCAFSIPYRQAYLSCLKRRKAGEETVFLDEEFLLVKYMKLAEWDSYRYSYANLLYRWGYYIQRCALLKSLSSAPVVEKDLIIYAEYNNKDRQNDSETSNVKEKSLFLGASNTSTVSKYPRCSVCEVMVRGLSIFCIQCGHGGHLDHLKNWFTSSKECASGCGCECKFVMSDMNHLSLKFQN